jgi:hypothetical protein
MEQQEPRKIFVKNLHKFCETIKLNKAFLEGLKKHSNWEYVEEVMVRRQISLNKYDPFLTFPNKILRNSKMKWRKNHLYFSNLLENEVLVMKW